MADEKKPKERKKPIEADTYGKNRGRRTGRKTPDEVDQDTQTSEKG